MEDRQTLNEKSLVFSKIAFWSSAGRDLFLVVAGILSVFSRPDSVESFGITGFLAIIWVAMLGGGAFVSLVGVLIGNTSLEVFGSSAVAGSFILWAIALVLQENATLVPLSLAFVFFSSALVQFYRITTLPLARSR